MRKHSRGVQLISLDLINFPWITKTEVSKTLYFQAAFFSPPKTFIVRMDGRMDGWTDGDNFSSNSSMLTTKLQGIEMCELKLSPTLLWVSKFGMKLRVGSNIFEITIGR